MGKQSQLVAGHGLIASVRKEYEAKCREIILGTLQKNFGNKQKTANELGINRTTLVEWCKRHEPRLVGKAR
jgi:transcriptional regulator with PAS, ATPase and Fis domain